MGQKRTPNRELRYADDVFREAARIAADSDLPEDAIDHALLAKASTIGYHIDSAKSMAARRGPDFQRILAKRLAARRQRVEDEPALNRCPHLRIAFLTAFQLPTQHQATQLSLA